MLPVQVIEMVQVGHGVVSAARLVHVHVRAV